MFRCSKTFASLSCRVWSVWVRAELQQIPSGDSYLGLNLSWAPSVVPSPAKGHHMSVVITLVCFSLLFAALLWSRQKGKAGYSLSLPLLRRPSALSGTTRKEIEGQKCGVLPYQSLSWANRCTEEFPDVFPFPSNTAALANAGLLWSKQKGKARVFLSLPLLRRPPSVSGTTRSGSPISSTHCTELFWPITTIGLWDQSSKPGRAKAMPPSKSTVLLKHEQSSSLCNSKASVVVVLLTLRNFWWSPCAKHILANATDGRRDTDLLVLWKTRPQV